MKQKPKFTVPNYWRPNNVIRFHHNYDFDRDKVPNYRDCQPGNPFKQDVMPNLEQRKRIKKLPIYIRQKNKGGSYHVLDKVPKALEKTQKKVLSVLKRRPDIIGEMERKKTKKLVFFPTFKGTDMEDAVGFEERGIAIVSTQSERRRPKQEDIHEMGSTAIHEIEHGRQRNAYHGKRYEKLFKGKKHSQRKGEKMAYAKEWEQTKKYMYLKSRKEFVEDVGTYMEREYD